MSFVLITGSNGFIGTKLTSSLLERGYKVLGISNSGTPKLFHENYKYLKVDITDSSTIEKVFSEYQISSVIHLAAIAHLKNRKKITWNEYYRVNTLASETIFRCAINVGAKIFFASTVDVYGKTNVSVVSENVKPNPLSNYAKSKYLAEKSLIKMCEKYSHPYVIGRFAPVYAKSFMKDVYKRLYLKYPHIAFYLGKDYCYHFVSINNVIDFIINWLKSSKNATGIFNVCDDTPLRIIEFIQLEKSVGNCTIAILLPKQIITVLKFVPFIIGVLFQSSSYKKIHNTLYKLTDPVVYSNERMKKIYHPKWNIKNTIYNGDIT